MNLKLYKYLISINKELISKTAMSNCHCIGLNSFIINEKPKIRLFIAEPNCELFEKFDYKNPLIAIHPHKYDDIFIQLEGKMINHLYEIGNEIKFNKYKFQRLSDENKELKLFNKEYLDYLGKFENITNLDSNQLHTVSLEGERCSWVIIETFEDENFEQIAYHQNLIERKELYKPMVNSIEYLQDHFLDKFIF